MEDKFSRSRAYKSCFKMVNIQLNSRLFIIIFGISTAKSKFSLAGARITNLPLITMIASQAKHKQNRVCLIEIYYLCVRAYEK